MRLSDSSHLVADPDQSIRGRTVVDRDGNEIGKVGDLLIDPQLQKVRLLRVEHGGLFGVGVTPLYLAAEAVESGTRDEVVAEPYVYYASMPYGGPGSVARSGRFFR